MAAPANMLQVKQDLTEARLSVLAEPAADWSAEARRAALARLRRMGLPHARDEYWKFTRPDSLTTPEPAAAAVFTADEIPVFDPIDRLKIVFVDGVFDAAASDDLELAGIRISRLAEGGDIHWARDLYGLLEERGQTPVDRPLAALNTARATDGVLIHVMQTPARPINIVYHQTSETSDAILHHLVKVDAGASVTLLENGPAAARFNGCIEFDIADTGTVHHVRTQGRDQERRVATHNFARLGAQSTFKSFTLTANGVLTRNETVIEFTGDDAVAHVAGACLGDGARGGFLHDDTIFITHDAERCESRQVFKKVLRNGAVGVFQGKILVKAGAQKTDGYQISQSLLLDDDSQFLAKPELEIYADDVACSHGSTSGAIDEEGLFYLRSRGIPEGPATDLMTIAFLAEAVQEIEDETLAGEVLDRVEAWLMRRRG